MIKILSFLALATIVVRAAGPADKFEISVVSAAANGNAVDFTMKITNQSAAPANIDISADAATVKGTSKDASIQVPQPTLRPGIYKPQFVILIPGDNLIFSTSHSARAFSPQALAPGESFTVVKSVPVNTNSLMKALDGASFEVVAKLLFESAANAPVENTAPSPTYKLSKTPDGKLALTSE